MACIITGTGAVHRPMLRAAACSSRPWRSALEIDAPFCGALRRFAGEWGVQAPSTNTVARSGMAGKYRPRVEESPGVKSKIQAAMPVQATHHQALERIADSFSFGGTGIAQAWHKRSVRLRAKSDRNQQEEIFQQSKDYLMEPERWTYGHMAAYQRKVLDLLGAYGWKRRFSSDDPSIMHLEKELKVLDAMTPVELASNHKAVFTREAKKLIAEKAAVTEKFVDQVIMEHDILRADRRWYMILEQFGKPAPQSFEDRADMAEYDRPFSETERGMRDDMMDKEEQKMKTRQKKPPKVTKVYYRQPTCGGNRWSTRVPRWYPSQWKMRPERARRLQGVGRPGGGGDRGRPWGRLAQFNA